MKKYIFKPVISDNFKSVLTAGSWCSYCAMVGDYDGAMAILVIYGILAIKKGYDRRKQSHPNKKSLQKEV